MEARRAAAIEGTKEVGAIAAILARAAETLVDICAWWRVVGGWRQQDGSACASAALHQPGGDAALAPPRPRLTRVAELSREPACTGAAVVLNKIHTRRAVGAHVAGTIVNI